MICTGDETFFRCASCSHVFQRKKEEQRFCSRDCSRKAYMARGTQMERIAIFRKKSLTDQVR